MNNTKMMAIVLFSITSIIASVFAITGLFVRYFGDNPLVILGSMFFALFFVLLSIAAVTDYLGWDLT